MEYYPALKRNEILIHAIMWIHLEESILIEINQAQRNKYCVVLLL